MLWYYDFEHDQLKSASSRSLFAREGANTAEVESRLNRLVETPIAAAREQLWANRREVSQDLEWPLYRALALLLLLQPFRAVESSDASQTIEEVISRPDDEVDGLARAIGTRWQLTRITVSNRAPLAYPAEGYFPLLGLPLGGKCSFGFAIPLSPIHAFVGVPAEMRPEQTEFWTANGAGLVSNYSVGHRSRFVVVHPNVVSALPANAIATAIRDARASVARGIELCGALAGILGRFDTVQ